MKLHPLFFTPIYKYRLWGGEKLRTKLNRVYEGTQMGESWEISNVEGSKSVVASGSLKGKSIDELIEAYGTALLGKAVYERFGHNFPLLIKFIDAKVPLSIQVHPNDEMAKQLHNSFGKNEMWYVMQANEGSEIISGFKNDTDPDTYEKALVEGRVLELLNTEQTQAGDLFHIPTGRIHAIGAGVLLAEIQQTSDITYRVYDYDRIDKKTGETRELHTEFATKALDFKGYDSYKIPYTLVENKGVSVLDTPYFKTSIIEVRGGFPKNYSENDSFVVLICVAGTVQLTCDEEEYVLNIGETVLIPACINHLIFNSKSARILEVTV